MSKFVIRQTAAGFKFDMLAANGQVILCSEGYSNRSGCLNGVESVKNNAPGAEIEGERKGE